MQGWIGFTLLSEMPSYLTGVLGFDLGSAGVLCVFPYLALFVSTLFFARLFDHLQREGDWKVDQVRKTAMFVAFMGSALGLVICGYLDNKYAAYGFMVLTQVRYKTVLKCDIHALRFPPHICS
jgi:MFS family permease